MELTFPFEIRATAKRTIPANLELMADLDLNPDYFTAAEAKADAKPTFHLLANTGKPMDLAGFFDPVVIDIAGAKFDKARSPVIQDHDVKLRIGHTTEQSIIPAGGSATVGGKKFNGPAIAAFGEVSSGMQVAKGFTDDAKNGFPFQVSVGAKVIDGYFVPEGEKVTVNGKTFKGPLIVASKTLIRELSITVLGADNDTAAKLAARTNPNPTLVLEFDPMDFEAYLSATVQSLGLDLATITAEQKTKIKAQYDALVKASPAPAPAPAPVSDDSEDKRLKAIAATEARVDAIKALADDWQSRGVAKVKIEGKEMAIMEAKSFIIPKKDISPQDFRLACMEAAMGNNETVSGPFIHSKAPVIEAQALEASILRFSGVPNKERNTRSGEEYGLETMFKPEVLEKSHDKQYRFGGSIQALLDIQIRAAGHYYASSDRRSRDFLAAAVHAFEDIRSSGFSTLNIPNVLENVMHKTSLAAFQAVEAVWRSICGRRPLTDFRPHNLYRLSHDGSFKKVAADGELKHVSMTDEKFEIQADTYGCMIGIDYPTIRNDDLGVVLDKARGIGTLGGQRIEESVFVLLLSNPSSFYHADNNNLITGVDSELNNVVEGKGLDLARQRFRNQVVNGKPTGVSPSVLLVGTTRETTAGRLFTQERIADNAASDSFIDNPHKGLYKPVVSPYLNNTDITDQDGAAISGQSDTQWYLFAPPSSPQGAAIVIGFLDAREVPFFDQAETVFSVPRGLQYRSYLDWGVAMHVTQMSVRSAGA